MDIQQTELEGLDRARAIHVAALNDGDANAWAVQVAHPFCNRSKGARPVQSVAL